MIDNLPATDTGGYAGLADSIDLHTFQLLKGVALATVLGVGTELAFGLFRQRPRPRVAGSRRKQPAAAPASAWSNATSMSGPRSPCVRAGRCA